MTCAEYRERLQERLDGVTAPESAELATHLADCPACRALHAAAGRLEQGLRSLPPPRPPADLAGRIALRVLAQRRRPARWRRGLFLGLSLAASLFLVVGLALRRPQPTERVEAPPPPPPPAVTPELPPPPRPSLGTSVAEATSAVASLTRRAADETVEGSRALLPPMPLPPADDPLTTAFEPPAESLREAGQGVATGLQPVADSARRAARLFLRDLTFAGSDAKPGL
jgi:predicted anti-sigma-YlaC factor YlaD